MLRRLQCETPEALRRGERSWTFILPPPPSGWRAPADALVGRAPRQSKQSIATRSSVQPKHHDIETACALAGRCPACRLRSIQVDCKLFDCGRHNAAGTTTWPLHLIPAWQLQLRQMGTSNLHSTPIYPLRWCGVGGETLYCCNPLPLNTQGGLEGLSPLMAATSQGTANLWRSVEGQNLCTPFKLRF